MANKLTISDPLPPIISAPQKKSELKKGVLFFALGTIALTAGILLSFHLGNGLTHALNTIGHKVHLTSAQEAQITRLLRAVLIEGAVISFYISSRKIIQNTVKGRILYNHLCDRLQRLRYKKFKSVLVNHTINQPQIFALLGKAAQSKFNELKDQFITKVTTDLKLETEDTNCSKLKECGKKFLNHLEEYKKHTYSSDEITESAEQGVCWGYICVVAKRILNGEFIEKVCQDYKHGADEEMIALQMLYNTIPKEITRPDWGALSTQGLKKEDIPEGRRIEKDGLYTLSIQLPSARHCLLMQIQGETVYVLDASHFLIKFDKSSFNGNIQKLFSLYYETAQHIPIENFDFDSLPYEFIVTKLSLKTNQLGSAEFGVLLPESERQTPFLLWIPGLEPSEDLL